MAATLRPPDPALPMRGFLLLDLTVRVFVWSTALTLTVALLTGIRDWPTHRLVGADLNGAAQWGGVIVRFTLLYNIVYVALLLLIRVLVPTPREGTYPRRAVYRLDRHAVSLALVTALVKARYQAPFPGFLVFHLAHLPPLCWLMMRVFGPHSRSVLVLDPLLPDPHLTYIGRNVVVGNMTSIIAHNHYADRVEVRRTVIEDDAMIGAHALVYGGCTIGRGALVYGGAVVPPNTTIGAYEAWGGVPARKIKDLPRSHDVQGPQDRE